MRLMQTLEGLLEHIKQVESETMVLSREAQAQFNVLIEKAQVTPDDATLEAMQSQDIVSQQLSATVEAIASATACLHECAGIMECRDTAVLMRCEEALEAALETARQKHLAFAGKTHGDDDAGIEFF